jgi:hypothetical protein
VTVTILPSPIFLDVWLGGMEMTGSHSALLVVGVLALLALAIGCAPTQVSAPWQSKKIEDHYFNLDADDPPAAFS